MDGKKEPIKWTRLTFVDDRLENASLAETLRDSLEIIGWPLVWTYKRDSLSFKFNLEQPGKHYIVSYSFNDMTADVIETPKGFWRTFDSLHGMGGSLPNSSIMMSWGLCTHLIVVLVLFSIGSGLYLWFSSKIDCKKAAITLIVSVLITSLWMFQLYFIG